MENNIKLIKDLQISVSDKSTRDKVLSDFSKTFERLGADKIGSLKFTEFVLAAIEKASTIEDAENLIKSYFEAEKIGGKTVFDTIQQGLKTRYNIIFNQLKPFLGGLKGKVIDYGCGSGMIAQMINDYLGLHIEGVDVRDFRASEVSVPVKVFDGYKVQVADKAYECAILTNVLHHEFENEKILSELDRIVSRRLVIIETVPEADDDNGAKQDWGRMILNDALWNRFFNYANIPVPGTYETPYTWIKRFEKYGWKCTHSEDLGFDQPTIQDRHHLMVFER